MSRPANNTHDQYLVPDLLAPGLALVFCGTAPSKASAAANAYYAKPGNRFWPTLNRVGLTPRKFQPHEYPLLLSLRIGLTDLCKVHCGTDAELPRGALDAARLEAKLRRYQPAWAAFTSKNAGMSFLGRKVEYGVQPETVDATRLFVLPSPSGLATRFWDETWWHELAQRVGSAPEAGWAVRSES